MIATQQRRELLPSPLWAGVGGGVERRGAAVRRGTTPTLPQKGAQGGESRGGLITA
jgi:hypothetical protein